MHRVVDYLKQTGQPDYINAVLQEPAEMIPGLSGESADVEDADPLYDEAVQIVIDSRRASISNVQRRLKIGYNRAARLIEEMERTGIVSAAQSNGNREVLAPPSPEVELENENTCFYPTVGSCGSVTSAALCCGGERHRTDEPLPHRCDYLPGRF